MAKRPLSEQALKVLKDCTVDGLVVKLPAGMLDRAVYLEVKKHLEIIGGNWKGGKTQGFVFEEDPAEMLEMQANGEGRDLKQEFQFFATPESLALRMVQLANVTPGMKILEPSAGIGDIVKTIQKVFQKRVDIDVCELMPLNIKKLERLSGINFIAPDFLKCDTTGQYDVIIANPPFSKNQDIEHIQKMYAALKTNGRIVTIASPSWTFGSQKKQVAFREWIKKIGAYTEELSPNTFQESGTQIHAVLLVIDKLETIDTKPPAEKATSKVYEPILTEEYREPEDILNDIQKSTEESLVIIDNLRQILNKNYNNMTKIIINTAALKKAFKQVKDVIDLKVKTFIITHVLLKIKDATHLDIVATDLANTIIIERELLEEAESGLEFLLPFELTNDFVNLIAAETLTIEVEDNKAIIRGMNDQLTIDKLQPVKDYPKVPVFPDAHTVTVGKDFFHWLSAATNTIADNINVPFTTVVCVDFEKDKVTLVSTTTKALFTKSFQVENKVKEQIMLGKKTIKALSNFDETQVMWNKNHVAFKSQGVTIIATQLDIKYAAWRTVLPNTDVNIKVNLSDLNLALKKASLAADANLGATLRLKETVGIVNIQAIDQKNARDAKADIIGDYTGECEKISFQPATFLKLLEQIDFKEVHLSIIAPNKPILISSPADASYLGMLMPIANA